MALASRNLMLPRASVLGQQTIQRAALEATVALPGGPVRLYCTHLCHLSGALRRRQAAALLDLHRLAPLEGAVIEGEHPDPGSRGHRGRHQDVTSRARRAGAAAGSRRR